MIHPRHPIHPREIATKLPTNYQQITNKLPTNYQQISNDQIAYRGSAPNPAEKNRDRANGKNDHMMN